MLVCLGNMLGKEFNGVIGPDKPLYRFIKNETLAMLSLVLTKAPLRGADGGPRERTYYAQSGDFAPNDIQLLKQVGELLHPDKYSPAELKRLIQSRRRLYRLDVRVPSSLMAFRLGGRKADGQRRTEKLVFECLDGGEVFPGPKKLRLVAKVKFGLEEEPEFDIDLRHHPRRPRDIDKYTA